MTIAIQVWLYLIPYNYTVEVTNRFKGLDLVDRLPEELWVEAVNIEQELVNKIIWKTKKKCKNVGSKEVLQIAVERREMKVKGEKEMYTQLNPEFQRRARNKKDFLIEQCKEIKENNKMGKTRNIFKKTGDTKRTFHGKMDTIKYRNHKNLTEAEDIWQEYTENYT